MKLRQKLEDFKVEEINEFDILKSGQFKLYLLEKKGLESFALIGYLAKQNNIPRSEIGVAGLKDKYAETSQYITIPEKYEIKTTDEKNFKITFIGFVDKPLKIGDLQGNRFEITVRDLNKDELEKIKQRAEELKKYGAPNYFDSQRFGSVINNKFIAKYVVKRDYENAAKIFLTEHTKFEKSQIKKEKKQILENWKNIENAEARTKFLRQILDEYRKTKDWLKAYKKINYQLRAMFVYAYQSYLWNECVKELLKKTVDAKKLYSVSYNIGTLLFYKEIDEKIPESFPSIGREINLDEFQAEIINKVLSKEGLSIGDFDVKDEAGNFFKAENRKLILKPEGFEMLKPEEDELNKGKYKITLNFKLPKGSYATIVTKKIFNK